MPRTPNENAGRSLDVMQQAAVKLMGMIDAMLLFQAGQQAVVLKSVNMTRVVTPARPKRVAIGSARHVDQEVTAPAT